jgi:hypothetical protein
MQIAQRAKRKVSASARVLNTEIDVDEEDEELI